jgi:hypothetical protein
MMRLWLHSVRSSPLLKRLLHIVLNMSVGVAALLLALQDVHPALIGSRLSELDEAWLVVSVWGVIVVALVKAARWRSMFDNQPHRPAYRDLLSAMVIGQIMNILLPFRAGELARAHLLKRRSNIAMALGLGTVISEKLADLAVFVAMTLFLSVVADVPDWLRRASGVILAVAGTAVVLTALFIAYPRWQGFMQSRFPTTWRARVSPTFTAFREGWSALWAKDVSRRLWLWSAAIWLLSFITPAAVAGALGWRLSIGALLTLLLALQVTFILPSPPGAIGVIQYACVLVLPQYGIDLTTAFAYGILLNGVLVIPLVLYGIALFVYESVRALRFASTHSA